MGDTYKHAARNVSMTRDGWIRVEWTKNRENGPYGWFSKTDWMEYDPCNPKISVFDVVNAVGPCTDLIPRSTDGGTILGHEKENDYCLVKFGYNDYKAYEKKVIADMSNTGIRKPCNVFKEDRYKVVKRNTKLRFCRTVYYVHFLNHDNRWMYMKDGEPVEKFENSDFFESPKEAVEALKKHAWTPEEWEQIDPEKNVSIFYVGVYEE